MTSREHEDLVRAAATPSRGPNPPGRVRAGSACREGILELEALDPVEVAGVVGEELQPFHEGRCRDDGIAEGHPPPLAELDRALGHPIGDWKNGQAIEKLFEKALFLRAEPVVPEDLDPGEDRHRSLRRTEQLPLMFVLG